MTDKPNCSTCPLPKKLYLEDTIHTKDAYVYDCPISGHWMPSKEDGGTIFKTGCLSHPGAREWLMADVIKELERRTKLFGGHYGVAYQSAIFLIRDGVKA